MGEDDNWSIEALADFMGDELADKLTTHIKILSQKSQLLEISIDYQAYIQRLVTLDDIEQIFSIALAESFNDDLAGYDLKVSHRDEKVTAIITDYYS